MVSLQPRQAAGRLRAAVESGGRGVYQGGLYPDFAEEFSLWDKQGPVAGAARRGRIGRQLGWMAGLW